MFRKTKYLLSLTLVFLFTLSLLSPSAIQEVDIIKGIPELYNSKIVWNMSVDDVYENIKSDNKEIAPRSKDNDGGIDAITCFDDFYLDNDIYYRFQAYFFTYNKLDEVILMFPEEEIEDCRNYYIKKYGAPTNMGKVFICYDDEYQWYSDETTIILYDGVNPFTDDERKVVFVAYYNDISNPYKDINGSLRTVDPYGLFHYRARDISDFIADNSITDYTKTEYISGFDNANICKYTFNMLDNYLGLTRNQYKVELTTDNNTSTARILSYVFKWEKSDVNKLIPILKQVDQILYSIYDTEPYCTYTSMYYNDSGIKEINRDTMISMISAQIQGIYILYYENDYYRYSIDVSISPDDLYIECEVSVS